MVKIYDSRLDLKAAFAQFLEEIKKAAITSRFGINSFYDDFGDDDYDDDYDSDFLREFHQNQKTKSYKKGSKRHPTRGSYDDDDDYDEKDIEEKLEDVKDIYFYSDIDDEDSLEIYTSLQELSEGLNAYDVVYDTDTTKLLMNNFRIFCTIIRKNVNGVIENQLIASNSYNMLLQRVYQEEDYYFD